MTAAEFLRRLWPSVGLYCIATPSASGAWSHRVCETVDAAAAYVESIKHKQNVFFCIHSLREHEVWNPTKKNHDGTVGGMSVRLQRNMLAARDFFFDLDVGANDSTKYASQEEALEGIRKFVADTKLPEPLLVSSGGGVHVHWVLNEDIDSTVWRGYAERLRQLGTQHGLRYDPARTTDSASVLRVPGTFNLKHGNKRDVVVLQDGEIVSLKAFDDAIKVTYKEPAAQHSRRGRKKAKAPESIDPILANRPSYADAEDIASNLEFNGKDLAPLKMIDVLRTCGQMSRLAMTKGKMSEPEWFHSLGVVKGTTKPEANAIQWSKGHPDFSESATLAKLDQHREKCGNGMTNCAKLRQVSGPTNDHICEGCQWGKLGGGSIWKATYLNATPIKREEDPAPDPEAPPKDDEGVYVEEPVSTRATYQPPYPYRRCPTGPGVEHIDKDKDGNIDIKTVLPYDFYPLRRVRNHGAKTEQHIWRFHPPKPEGTILDITIDAGMFATPQELQKLLFNQGVLPRFPNQLVLYMSAYIQHLQSLVAPSEQYNHVGWVNDHQDFVLGTTMIQRDGTTKPVSIGPYARDAEKLIRQKGTLEAQVKNLEFFNHPDYLGHQLMILMSLASPYFYATGHHGVIVSANGPTGVSKSTSMYTGAAFWGDPDLYALTALPGIGATVNGRYGRIELLSNLPFCFDELTDLPDEDIRTLALAISQPTFIKVARISDGSARPTIDFGNVRSSILMATSNKSLHAAVATANEAGTAASMRILEMNFVESNARTKDQADEFIRQLMRNYGHIGPEFIKKTIPFARQIVDRINLENVRLGKKAGVRPEERFWFAAVATALTVGRIAKTLKLIPFDIDAIEKWVIEHLLPSVRGTVKDESDQKDPVRVLSDYMEHIDGEIVKVRFLNGKFDDWQPPRSSHVSAHYQLELGKMWLLGKTFREYCAKNCIDRLATIAALRAKHIITNSNIHVTLGRHTMYAKGQSWCIEVNMQHPEIAGLKEQLDDIKAMDNVYPIRPGAGAASAAAAAE